jgi:hypothetical protein
MSEHQKRRTEFVEVYVEDAEWIRQQARVMEWSEEQVVEHMAKRPGGKWDAARRRFSGIHRKVPMPWIKGMGVRP